LVVRYKFKFFRRLVVGLNSSKTIELNSSTFDDFVKKLNQILFLFDRFMVEEQFGWRVESCPDALKILDTEDLDYFTK
jgi:hypothetical protein